MLTSLVPYRKLAIAHLAKGDSYAEHPFFFVAEAYRDVFAT